MTVQARIDAVSDLTLRVSVVMPVRNGGNTLARAVDTVLSDLGPDDELIVVDDGSNDGAITRLGAHDQLRVLANNGSGIVAALNTGLGAARGEYFARCDADDEWIPGHTARLLELLKGQSNAAAAFGAARLIDNEGIDRGLSTPPKSEAVGRVLLRTNPLIHGTVLARLAVVRNVGGYRDVPGAEDYELWLRLLRTSRIVTTSAEVYVYRMSGSEAHRVKRRRQARSSLWILLAHAFETGRFSLFGIMRNAGSAVWPFRRLWYRA